MLIVNWNVEWAGPSTPEGKTILQKTVEHDPEVVCFTEAYQQFPPQNGHTITSAADYGYAAPAGRRKVVLWSKQPWTEVDEIGASSLPSGRFVSGLTETSLGAIRFIGVCIPWNAAHVTSGRRDRIMWEDHLSYLDGLAEVLNRLSGSTVVIGDFNQRIPRRGQPRQVANRLTQLLHGRLSLATSGILSGVDQQTIDHIAHTHDLIATDVTGISRFDEAGVRLSDHFGVILSLRSNAESVPPA